MMEKVYYKVHNKLEYLRVLRLIPDKIGHRFKEDDWRWINNYKKTSPVFIGYHYDMEYSIREGSFTQEDYQLKPLYDFKEYLNQIEEC